MVTLHTLRVALPALILLSLVTVGLGAGYYFASAHRGDPRVSWHVNPLQIRVLETNGPGSASDSFTCSSNVSPVTLRTFSSDPKKVTVSVNPSSFPTCGSTPDHVVVTATCVNTAGSEDQGELCEGSHFTGVVQVCGPTSYQCLSKTLTVSIQFVDNDHDT